MSGQYQNLKDYIHSQWNELLVHTPHDTVTHIGLPHAFIAPSTHAQKDFVFKEQFYWDTYFILQGLIGYGRDQLGAGMVDNVLHLLQELGYVPNSNNRLHLGRSQPPLSSAMVRMVYDKHQNKQWLEGALRLIEQEYHMVWKGIAHPHHREVYGGLSRYYNENKSHRGAEDESGWDYTTRFEDRAMDFLPVDLNNFLYSFEHDIAYLNLQLGHSSADWVRMAELRRQEMDELFWNESAGFYFDYDYVAQRQSPHYSLAGFTPLFSGAASAQQAERIRDHLADFETPYGLVTTRKDYVPYEGHQWATPNGWAPLHFLVVNGLERYGYADDAKRIAKKWIQTVNNDFEKCGYISEKYNVVSPEQPALSAVYPDQIGFAWTNAVSLYFIEHYDL